MLGVNKGKVILASHDSSWRSLFDEEKTLLNSLIGDQAEDIQHMGSTAINGIQAKPIIDILVGVTAMEDIKAFDEEKLREQGYFRLKKVVLEGKVVFAKFSSLENLTKTHILHVVEHNGGWWKAHTFFRDYLNEHPETANAYERHKQELAERYPDNEKAYTDGKKMFVDQVLAKQ
ncbi:GrpB family protein [Pseudalkalibacillus berkeleyi]|uniref:GrpB family protein n=1 Tax=Pseudalkalibacillus berkeleyi TaxID=1069813 RepID=A0ABS9H4Z9_9BACL|nr:GrpB family protein [Pseudalkalibacillus berkeleyi]MCF6139171.1 GrpB family protein [Pseudalkalibacillus berkeleyi]